MKVPNWGSSLPGENSRPGPEANTAALKSTHQSPICVICNARRRRMEGGKKREEEEEWGRDLSSVEETGGNALSGHLRHVIHT